MKIFWLILGTVSLIAGTIGLFLPIVPTVPFIILAAYCYARSSDRVYLWLLNHKVFGPMIRDWQENGSIARKTKIISTISILASLTFPLLFQFPLYVLMIQCVILAGVIIFIWTRPEPPKAQSAKQDE